MEDPGIDAGPVVYRHGFVLRPGRWHSPVADYIHIVGAVAPEASPRRGDTCTACWCCLRWAHADARLWDLRTSASARPEICLMLSQCRLHGTCLVAAYVAAVLTAAPRLHAEEKTARVFRAGAHAQDITP